MYEEDNGKNTHPAKQQREAQQKDNKTTANKINSILAATDNNIEVDQQHKEDNTVNNDPDDRSETPQQKLQQCYNKTYNVRTRQYRAMMTQKQCQKLENNDDKNLFGDYST